MKIGAMTACFRKTLREGLEICSALGVDGVQIWATGEIDPDTFSETVRQDLLATLKSLRLEISALCGDLGRGFTKPDRLDEDITQTKRMMDMARSLGVRVLTTHIGVVPDDPSDGEYVTMQQAMEDIGAYGERLEITCATETGPESAAALAAFLKSIKTTAIKANYDPANLLMNGYDAIQGVYDLRDDIVHTHAKDAISKARGPREVPLGEGDVSWPKYLRALREIGYRGYLTIEREVGDNPKEDIIAAAGFLKNQLESLTLDKTQV